MAFLRSSARPRRTARTTRPVTTTTTTTRTTKPSLMSRLTGRRAATTTTTTRRRGRPAATGVHHKRKPSIGDKVSGAMLKLKGSLTGRPGVKAAGTRRMHGTDGRGARAPRVHHAHTTRRRRRPLI